MIIWRPFISKLCNIFMIINESCLVTCAIIFCVFLKPSSELYVSSIGWLVIALVVINLTTNIAVLWIEKSVFLYRRCCKRKRGRPSSPKVIPTARRTNVQSIHGMLGDDAMTPRRPE